MLASPEAHDSSCQLGSVLTSKTEDSGERKRQRVERHRQRKAQRDEKGMHECQCGVTSSMRSRKHLVDVITHT